MSQVNGLFHLYGCKPRDAPHLQLSGKLDVETVLTHAEALAEHAGPRGRQLLAQLDSA
jgi:hypothetical protein